MQQLTPSWASHWLPRSAPTACPTTPARWRASAGLAHCRTPWLLCVPCDTPLLPLDLAARMLASRGDADIVIAHGWDTEHAQPGSRRNCAPARVLPVAGRTRLQPERFITSGGRKIDAWTGQHHSAQAVFDRPGDEQAFSNANTLAQLLDLEQIAPERQY
jgi:molybdopterin-guanine dinucleotide biosynthesis protein A